MKKLIRIPEDADLPLIGTVMFGIIDRGTNLLQIRPTTVCNLNCIFCSTDAGKNPWFRVTDYIVDVDYLVEWIKEVISFKGEIHAFIDSVGEPFTHPHIFKLIKKLSQIEEITSISIETNGTLLDERKIEKLVELGVERINLSLHSLNQKLAEELAGCKYNLGKILQVINIINESPIDLILTPVWIPGINDQDILKIIDFAKKIKNKKYPILGIQKYEVHKYGRKVKGVKPISWYHFFRKVEEWEKMFKMKLRIYQKDFKVERRRKLPIVFEKGEKTRVSIKTYGWMRNEMIAEGRERCITVIRSDEKDLGKNVTVRIIRNKDNIYIGEKL